MEITHYAPDPSSGHIRKLVTEITAKVNGARANPSNFFTIFRLPENIRHKNKDLYEPRIVSIGPYFNGSVALQAMEKYKYWCLHNFISWNTENNIEKCISELEPLESKAQACYFEDVGMSSHEFLAMMLLDGSFIIEFLIKWSNHDLDTIFKVGWAKPVIRSDLLMLENQLPLFVVAKLFHLLGTSIPNYEPFLVMLAQYVSNRNEKAYQYIRESNVPQGQMKHILHIYYLYYVRRPTPPRTRTGTGCLNLIRRSKSINRRPPRSVPSASELHEAGVIFKCSRSDNFLDIKFQNGTLEIPFISIEEIRRCHLSNLVSFEQCDTGGHNLYHLTSYATFMGCLVQTPRDVTLLQKKRIIDNMLATDEELVFFFNWLTECSFMDYDTHYLKQVYEDVTSYHGSDWHRWRATVKRDYFSNPWSIISLTAGVVVLALSVLQTIYSILAYYHGWSVCRNSENYYGGVRRDLHEHGEKNGMKWFQDACQLIKTVLL